MPLYFSDEHFERALPQIKKTIRKLCPERKQSVFDSSMVLDVMPKMINTFAVLVSDEGVAASKKSFLGIMRIHKLFLALANKFPWLKRDALLRLKRFVSLEQNRMKCSCPSLGNLLPLLMIVDKDKFNWTHLRSTYLDE